MGFGLIFIPNMANPSLVMRKHRTSQNSRHNPQKTCLMSFKIVNVMKNKEELSQMK